MGKVAIIIPNWNGVDFLPDCLNSLADVKYDNFEVVVVDNGSSDNSVAMLGENYSKAIIIQNSENLGFAAACNRGIKYAIDRGADFVLLLNNDTVVTPDFLSKMLDVAEHDQVGIVGSKILYDDDRKKVWFAGGDFIWWRVSGKHREWMKNDRGDLTGIVDCDFVTGCNMLIRKEVFQNIDFFYEPYFLTVEDLDFCYQARKNGWLIKTNLDAKIYHKVSLSRDGEFSFSNGYYGTRNRLFFAFVRSQKYFGGLVFLFFVLPIRMIQWFFLGRFEMLRGAICGVRDFFMRRMYKL